MAQPFDCAVAPLRRFCGAAVLGLGLALLGASAARAQPDAASPRQACETVVALAEAGAAALDVADVLAEGPRVLDLRNDGKLVRVAAVRQGTSNSAALELDDDPTRIAPYPQRFIGAATLMFGPNSRMSLLRIAGRLWEVWWEVEPFDGTAELFIATDGTTTCRFDAELLPPVVTLSGGGDPARVNEYRRVLFHAREPREGFPAMKVDAEAIRDRADLPPDWRVDENALTAELPGRGPRIVVRLYFEWGGGAGCAMSALGVVDGEALSLLFGSAWFEQDYAIGRIGLPVLYRTSPELEGLMNRFVCRMGSVWPVRDGMVVMEWGEGNRVLVGLTGDAAVALAQLRWPIRNRLDWVATD